MAEPIERETGGNSSSICLSVKGREGNPGIPWRTDRLIPYTLLLLLLSLPFIPSALSKHLLLLLLRSPDRISLSEISDSALLSRFLRGEKRKGKKKRDTKMKTNYFSRESRRRIIALPNPDLEARRSARLLPISTPFPTIVTNTGRNPEEMRKIMKERDVK